MQQDGRHHDDSLAKPMGLRLAEQPKREQEHKKPSSCRATTEQKPGAIVETGGPCCGNPGRTVHTQAPAGNGAVIWTSPFPCKAVDESALGGRVQPTERRLDASRTGPRGDTSKHIGQATDAEHGGVP